MSFSDQPHKPQRLCSSCGHSESIHNHESYEWDDVEQRESPIYGCDLCDCTCFANEHESQSSQHCDSGYMNDVRFGTE